MSVHLLFTSSTFLSQYRNQLSLHQDERLHLQREALHQRQAELRSVDQRIYELQLRLQKKRESNMTLYQTQQQQQTHLFSSASGIGFGIYNNNSSSSTPNK